MPLPSVSDRLRSAKHKAGHTLAQATGRERRNKHTGAFQSFARARILEEEGTEWEPIGPLDLFRRFRMIDQGAPGNQPFAGRGTLATGFGGAGTRATVGASFDFGDLILPGLLQIEAGVKVQASRAKTCVVALLRQSEHFYGEPYPRPYCLMAFEGTRTAVRIGLEASVGIGLPASVTERLPDEVSLSLGAGASAGAAYEGSLLRVREPRPEWFASVGTEDIALAFARKVPENKRNVKFEVARALHLAGFLRDDPTGRESKDVLLPELARWLELLEKPGATGLGTSVDMGDLEQQRRLVRSLQTRLQAAISAEKAPPPSLGIAESELAFLDLWGHEGSGHAGAQCTASGSVAYGTERARSFDQEVGPVTFGANGSTSFNVHVEAGASAQVAVDGSLKWTSSRFQTWAMSSAGPIVVTQDTRITYRQARASAEAWASAKADIQAGAQAAARLAASVGDVESGRLARGGEGWMVSERGARFEREKSQERSWASARSIEVAAAGELAYQGMTWHCGTWVWKHPRSVTGRPTGTVDGLWGTGLSWGTSVLTGRLALAIAELTAGTPSPRTASLAHALARQLRIDPGHFQTVLVEIGRGLDLTTVDADALLLESAFYLPGQQLGERRVVHAPVKANKAQTAWLLEGSVFERLRAAEAAGPASLLQSVRVRQRNADLLASEQVAFSLRPKRIPVLNLELAKVEEAGSHAVVDLFTWWAPVFRDLSVAELDGLTVPPVALFHQ